MSARTIGNRPPLGSASGLPVAGAGRIGPLAARLSLTAEQAAAARRQGERLESAGIVALSLEAWRLSVFIEPGDATAWRGMSRCLRSLGDVDGSRTADIVATRLSNGGES